ncbi:unnamed protein product [Cuscuta campestris]|uniref:CCHC-type domain-containing protein n=2 Tax=Cuscuta sect. Cleistogrammica TaxID=1824901 RepID=A0A484K1D9_9ASTE|nr:hypothetical protein DM860_008489 [Cuscuta australis]VFQ58418.1 unnamed protein product [Cuscuta campestris]
MEGEDFINLPACSGSEFESEDIEQSNMLSPIRESVVVGDIANNEVVGIEGDVGIGGASDTLEVTENTTFINSKICTDNGSMAVGDECNISGHLEDENPARRSKICPTGLSGAKRPRTTLDEDKPFVHVIYNALPRESKQKLEELLQKWSQWHAEHCSSIQDPAKSIESGKETYFPALLVGLEKPCAVPFWMDDQPKNKVSEEYTALDTSSVPLYDRTYTFALTSSDSPNKLEGGLGVDASRCFNCGSYGHSLKECPKPRDNVAVNNARKLHKAKRNHGAASRNPTRYYQNSPKGKYDGLRPGVLDCETRRLLGLGELDPPPWLYRMREIGYPPGYLESEEDLPSGITIFEDEEETVEETEEGEIQHTSCPDPPPPTKMSVEFPGVNAPIPKDADNWIWSAAGPSPSFRAPRASSYSNNSSSSRHYYNTNQSNHTPEVITDRSHLLERQLSRDYYEHEGCNHRPETINRSLEDDGPPGCGRDLDMSPSLSKRFRDFDSGFSALTPRGGNGGSGSSGSKASSYERSHSRHRR